MGHGRHRVEEPLRRAQRIARGRIRTLSEDQEFPLACLRAAFSRLPPAPRRASGSDLRHDRSRRRTGAQDRRDMLGELREDNKSLIKSMRTTHILCEGHGDVATASLLEVWIDEAEKRV